jgi:predicted porin
MKKYLLGTTAVVAATAFGGAAYAQSASEPIKLGLGGYWRGAIATTVGVGGPANNEKTRQGTEQDSLIVVSGSSKFDNGLGVGVSIQFRGEGVNGNTTSTVKRSYVRFFGQFGEVRFGDDEDSRLQKAIDAPQAGSLFGVNSPFIDFTNAPPFSNSTQAPIGVKRSHKIAYFSPTIAGFSFAASYAPQNKQGCISCSYLATNTAGFLSNAWSMGGLYDNKFGDFRLQASAGYTAARVQGNGTNTFGQANPSAWDMGVNLGWGPVTVGGSFEHQNNRQTSANNNLGITTASGQGSNTFDVGAVYTIGPFSVSADFSRGMYQGFAQANATSTLNIYEIITDYVLGPGVSVGAAIQFDYYRSGVNAQARGATPGNVGNATNNMHDASLEVGTTFTF